MGVGGKRGPLTKSQTIRAERREAGKAHEALMKVGIHAPAGASMGRLKNIAKQHGLSITKSPLTGSVKSNSSA